VAWSVTCLALCCHLWSCGLGCLSVTFTDKHRNFYWLLSLINSFAGGLICYMSRFVLSSLKLWFGLLICFWLLVSILVLCSCVLISYCARILGWFVVLLHSGDVLVSSSVLLYEHWYNLILQLALLYLSSVTLYPFYGMLVFELVPHYYCLSYSHLMCRLPCFPCPLLLCLPWLTEITPVDFLGLPLLFGCCLFFWLGYRLPIVYDLFARFCWFPDLSACLVMGSVN
jgi:hypothetical protein